MNDILLLELTIKDSPNPDVKFYFASETYVSDTNIVYKGDLSSKNPISITKEMGHFVWGTQSRTTYGNIVLLNDGTYDDFYNYEMRDSVIIASIVKSDAPIATAVKVAEFIVNQVSNKDDDTITISITDKLSLVDKNTTHQYFENTIQFVNNRDQPEPIAFGYVYQADIPLVDKVQGEYQLTSEFNIFDRININNNHELKDTADPFIITTDYTIEVTPITGGIGIDLVNTPSGTITCDYIGFRYLSLWSNTLQGMVGKLLVGSGGLATSDIDFTSAAVIDTDLGYKYGYYAKRPTNIVSILDSVVASFGGFYYQNNDGKITFDYLQAPATPTLDINTINLASGVKVSIDLAIGLSDSVAARKNVYVFSYDDVKDVGGLSEEDKQTVSSDYQFYKKSTATVAGNDAFPATYAHAQNGCYIPTLLTEEADAADLITKLEALYNVTRYNYDFDFLSDNILAMLELELNTTITLTHDRYGLDAGKDLRVTKIRMNNILDNKISIRGWG